MSWPGALVVLPVALAAQGEIDRIEVDATFLPEERRIEAVARYVWRGPPREELAFYLDRSLVLEAVEGEGVLEVERIPGATVLEKVGNRHVVRSAAGGEASELVFRYSGPLPEAFAEGWIEVFADRLWIPMHESLARRLEYDCALRVPESYRLVGYGSVEKTGDTWRLRSVEPSFDVPFVAGETEARDFERAGRRVRIVSRAIEPSDVAAIASDVHRILECFHGSFASESPRDAATIVLRPGARSPAYARPGYVVTGLEGSYSDQRVVYVGHLAHELSHLWWLQASPGNWENWLNEGFAEYSSLLAVRELHGEKMFERRVESYRRRIAEAPPILGLDRAHPMAELAFYWKPAVILSDLEERIGREELLSLWRHVLAEHVDTTEELLALLARLEGPEESAWLRAELER